MAKSLRLVTGLCVLLALAAPLRGALELMSALKDGEQADRWMIGQDASVVTEGDEYLNRYLTTQSREAVEAWVKDTLNERFGISPDCCRVVVTMGSDDETGLSLPRMDRLDIVLSGSAFLRNPHVIEEWFENETGCVCCVSVE